MDKVIQAEEATRQFDAVLRAVREGQSYVVTAQGHPVARIVPVETEQEKRARALEQLLERLKAQPATHDIGPWTRDELYKD